MTSRDFLLALLIEVEDWMPGDPPMAGERHLSNHREWLTDEHCGDCTKVPMTCVRCASEEREARADAALAFMKASGFALQTTQR
jgi:hypothetical protein